MRPENKNYTAKFSRKPRSPNDYTGMKILPDELYAAIVAYLLKEERVQLFSRLLMCKGKEAETDNEGADNGNDE